MLFSGTSLSVALALCCLTISTTAFSTEWGLNGFPANPYDPVCATACLRSFSSLDLSCSDGGVTVGMVTFATSTECFAHNAPFLTSVAWCADSQCADADPSAALMEYWWDMQITGQKTAGVATVPAMWTYAQALAHAEAPTVQLMAMDTALNVTSRVPSDVYEAQYNVLWSTHHQGTLMNKYGIIMLAIGFGLPVIMTWLSYILGEARLMATVRAYVVWPSTIGSYHVRSLPHLIGKAPTIGQALYVALFLALNIVLTSVSYQSKQPNAWNPTGRSEIMSYVLGRTGTLAYIFMPLLFLFGGRNNILLWMTNWSHSTFLLLHRWIARIFTVQVLIHSVVSLVKYAQNGMYGMENKKPYWIWGIVATLCVVVLCFGSGLYVRNNHYEVFLTMHVVLSIIIVVGCWYHAYDLYGLLGGYCYWIYATSAVWAFDRGWRRLRIWSSGLRRASVSQLGEEDGYVRIDIPGIRWSQKPGTHAYVYFPALTPWRPWENHPFSVMPTIMLRPPTPTDKIEYPATQGDSHSSSVSEHNVDIEHKSAARSGIAAVEGTRTPVGLTFFVRKSFGGTTALSVRQDQLTFVEGPYANNDSDHVLRCDRLLLIGGGIGITALVPFLASHWNVKLCWSVKESARCLVDELEDVLANIEDKHVRVGSQMNIDSLLDKEVAAGWEKLGVVVSGPPSLCDDVRALLVQQAKQNPATTFELEVEAYSW
ncbi:hypothetical protein LTR27_000871 [Elasticomyces elasticus]|nr:hypothetical protein LTR27_000871 [Elasticomyces elasticus]